MLKKVVVAVFIASAASSAFTAAIAAAAGPWHGPFVYEENCRNEEDRSHSEHGGIPGQAYTCEYKADQPEGNGFYYYHD